MFKIFVDNKLRISEGLFFTLLWSAIYMVPLLNAEMTARQGPYLQEVFMAWSRITPYFLVFVLNNNLLAPRFLMYSKRSTTYFLLNILCILTIFGSVAWIQENIVHELFERESPGHGPMTLTELSLLVNVSFSVLMILANSGIKMIYKSIRDEQLMSELRTQNMQVEMDYLKYQINPHFFMNTLNNIHALIDIDTNTAKGAVIDLSKMMRYVLYESGNNSTTLSHDIKFLENYIELMRIRYCDEVTIQLDKSDNLPLNATIPPLLLIVFVENAFKHGANGGKNAYINLMIEYHDSELHFCVENSIGKRTNASKSGGIGLINVRKRLELIYGDKFKLLTQNNEDRYKVELTIPIDYA